MAEKVLKLDRAKLLIGEGDEEIAFFSSLLQHLQINDVQVEQSGGKHGLLKYLRALAKRSGYFSLQSIGITRDANGNLEQARAEIEGAVNELKRVADEVNAAARPRVESFLLPDNTQPGMLEDLCLQSVSDDVAMPCVEDYFTCVNAKANRSPSPLAKAKVRVWLASHSVPDKRLGHAAKEGYWNFEHPCFELLIAFIRSL